MLVLLDRIFGTNQVDDLYYFASQSHGRVCFYIAEYNSYKVWIFTAQHPDTIFKYGAGESTGLFYAV